MDIAKRKDPVTLESPVLGIDVSEHNGVIDWSKVKPNIDFAMLRAGYGKNGTDKMFELNAKGCVDHGIPFGVYWFSYACSSRDAEIEAISVLDKVKSYHLDYPIAFDWEDDSLRVATRNGIKIEGSLLPSAFATKFLGIVQKAGYTGALYSNPAYLNKFFNKSVLNSYDLWLAQWPGGVVDPAKRPSHNGVKANIWQYSAKGSIDGIRGDVDKNLCYVNYPETNLREVKNMTADEVYSLLMQKLNFEKQANWAEKEITTARERKFTDGSRPYQLPSRAEVMTMVNRVYEALSTTNSAKLSEFNAILNDVSTRLVELEKKTSEFFGAHYCCCKDNGK